MDREKRVTQADRILELLSDGNWHTALEFCRLQRPILCHTRRIFELRKSGHNIVIDREGNFPAYRLVRP